MDRNELARAMKDRFFKSVQAFTAEVTVRKDDGFSFCLWHEFLNYLEGKGLEWWTDHGAFLEIFEDRLKEKHSDLFICLSLTLLYTYYMWLFKNHQHSSVLEEVRLGMDRAEEFDLALKESECRKLLGELH
jgi:hypothetical protein